MSMALLSELSDGLMEIYDEIGVPMTYIPLDVTVAPDKFGTLIPSYDITKQFVVSGLLNQEEKPDPDTVPFTERVDGKVAIVTKNFVDRGITPKAKDKIEVVDTAGRKLNYVVVGISRTPGSQNVGIPFLITYLNVVLDSTLARE